MRGKVKLSGKWVPARQSDGANTNANGSKGGSSPQSLFGSTPLFEGRVCQANSENNAHTHRERERGERERGRGWEMGASTVCG